MRPHAISVLLALTATTAAAAATKPNVIVSFQPYYSITKTIAGPHADVTRLVPIGANPHEFEPRPSEVKRVATADLVLLNGLGLDEWVEDLARSSGTKAKLVPIGETLKFQAIQGEDHDHGDEHGHGGGSDPHIWLDASIMAGAATLIGEQLARTDPTNAAAYRARARAEHTKLTALHKELKNTLAPVRNEGIVTLHGAWSYWSRAYGPKIAAVIEPFPGKEPSVKDVQVITQLLRNKRARAIFAEPQLPGGPARIIAESAKMPLHFVVPEGSRDTPDYYTMMRSNAKTFLSALKRPTGGN